MSGMTMAKSVKKTKIEGISLRRRLKFEPNNYVRKTICIQAELLEALGPHADLTFEINMALERTIIKDKKEREHPAVMSLAQQASYLAARDQPRAVLIHASRARR
jgi:hypothetical protein